MFGKKKHLTCEELKALTELVADVMGLTHVTPEKIEKCYRTEDVEISVCHKGLLWVSKDYLVYEFEDAVQHYVYLTKRYIKEERRLFMNNGGKLRIPDETTMVFENAEIAMKESGRDYWVDPQFEDTEEE